jgi:hypothetical protein
LEDILEIMGKRSKKHSEDTPEKTRKDPERKKEEPISIT